ncbi:MAG: tRNA (adenosine(37)-N6)-threonylcarbamoyltransferase complex transferase subunit TsaD, partial [Clostridia bacterium]|nr:tRNA (adenosine(37)-N6)-threonylcarbamoyltransferase complex transferase subunit TsaD [Clostridia bacterium]
LLHRFQQTDTPFDPSLFAAAYTYEAVEAVKHQTETALDKYPHTALAVAGGVAANSHLRAELADLCRVKGVPFIIPPRSLCGDNGAMIAAQGYYEYLAGHFAGVRLNAFASDVPGEK